MSRLKDKVILLTGAAGDVGGATARAIECEGGVAIRSDVKERPGIDHALDVTSEADWKRVIADVDRKFGRLEGLVNSAGIARVGSIEDTDLDAWRRTMSVNLDGTFLGCKYGMRLLKRKGGSIVNIASIAGMIGTPTLLAYGASKGGVRLLSKSVALHGARLDPQVRCNSVHPAFLEGEMSTEILGALLGEDVPAKRLISQIPLARLGQPAEVADLVVYLLSDESRFVTGAEFTIDGGLTAR